MANFKQPQKQPVATPVNMTEEAYNTTVAKLTAHFTPILTPTLMIAHRKGCYATVINSTIAGVSLEATLGTDNAKVATQTVLDSISATISAI